MHDESMIKTCIVP